jgi:hypothetical protein
MGSVSYLWDDGITTATDTCLDPGYHYVWAIDSAGCQQITSFYAMTTNNCYVDISGYVYCDVNYNCVKQPADYPIANVGISLSGINKSYYTNTDNAGYYNFHVLNDTFNLSQYVPQFFNQLCPMPVVVPVIIPSGTSIQVDFADSADSYFDDAVITNCFSSPDIRAMNDENNITVVNKGTTVLNGTVSVALDPAKSYVSAFPVAGYAIPTRTITWNYNQMVPGEVRNFRGNSILSAVAPLGSIVRDSVTVTPLLTDLTPSNNYCYDAGTVKGAFDPNYKIEYPLGEIQKDSLWHSYTIHFQNTGTSFAHRVVVEDTLDVNLNPSTLCDLVSSHAFSIDTSSLPLVRFVFDNINLLDSGSSQSGSQGFITFRIQHYPGMSQGIILANKAEIYFDFNPAIETNTVTNQLVDVVGLPKPMNPERCIVFPNPSKEEFNFLFKERLIYAATIDVTDILGKLILRGKIEAGNQRYHLLLPDCNSGIYFYRISEADKIISKGKLMIVR